MFTLLLITSSLWSLGDDTPKANAADAKLRRFLPLSGPQDGDPPQAKAGDAKPTQFLPLIGPQQSGPPDGDPPQAKTKPDSDQTLHICKRQKSVFLPLVGPADPVLFERATLKTEAEKAATKQAALEPVLLTPGTIAEHGYRLACDLVDQAKTKDTQWTRPTAPVMVHLRLGRGAGASFKDLKVIKGLTLVVRDGNAALLSVPVHAELDPSNYVSLYVKFSTQRDLLPKMQLWYDEDGERGRRTFTVDLKPFMKESVRQR